MRKERKVRAVSEPDLDQADAAFILSACEFAVDLVVAVVVDAARLVPSSGSVRRDRGDRKRFRSSEALKSKSAFGIGERPCPSKSHVRLRSS